MFKPLLRTLPTLSGNFTIACKLREFNKENNNEYSTYVRLANIIPLQNYMANRNIELNLLNGKYEYDISKYHYYYSNVFYKNNFSYNKNNYAILDLDSIYNYSNDSRNKDYEFGCKRIQYSQNGSQFNFYAPIYIDNANDLPEYFCINLVFNNHLTKTIKVYINKDNKRNYLKTYLTRYLKQIDERVIFCLPESMQATYFGIDVKNGGIEQYKDNVFGNLYINQKTINNFDYTICKGFERNNMIMRQIIPLSFSFNINDLFNNYENEFFKGIQIKVFGNYHTYGGTIYDMYDFDINYTNSYIKYNKYNEYSGQYEYVIGKDADNKNINIMDVGFPALNESKYIKYEYTNKITPMYCKFKMMLSNDNHPYITNINFAYSFNQYPNQKYGEFPTMFKGLFPKVIIYNSDLKIPIGSVLDNYYRIIKNTGNKLIIDSNNIDKYNKLMSNFSSSWYNIIQYDIDFNDENTVNSFFNDYSWADVKYGYSYFNGIIYNFKNLLGVDKFAVFCAPRLNYISNETFYNELVKADMILCGETLSTNKKIFNYNQLYNMKIYDEDHKITYYNKLIDVSINNINDNNVKINQNMIKDIHGTYIIEENYIEENKFYKVSDILQIFDYYFIIQELLDKITEKQINGYELLEGYNNINYFKEIINEYGETEKQFMFINNVYNTQQYDERFNWIYNSLYYTAQLSQDKYKVSDRYESIFYNEDINGKLCMFIKDTFIHKTDLINILKEYNEDLTRFGDLNSLVKSAFMYLVENNYDDNSHVVSNIDIPIQYNNGAIKRKAINDWIKEQLGNQLYNDFKTHYGYDYFRKILNEMIVEYNTHSSIAYTDINPSEQIIGNNLIFLLTYLPNITSYKYEVSGNYNGIDIKNYFIKNYDSLKSIYVDPYNIKEYIDLYNNLYSNKINNDFTYTRFFSEIINKDHLIEYCNKLKESDSIYNSTMNNVNLLDIIYVKERCWVIENHKMYPKDRYISLYKYLVIKFSGNQQIIVDNIHNMYSLGNEIILNWFTNSLSSIKNENNKFILSINVNNISVNLELELCIYKYMILLDDNLRKLLNKNYFLYLYTFNNNLSENLSMWPIISNDDIINHGDYIYKDINDYLTPLFTNIYFNEQDTGIIKQMLDTNKINKDNKYVVTNNKYFKEIDVDNTFRNLVMENDYIIYNTIDKINQLTSNNTELFNEIKKDLNSIIYYNDDGLLSDINNTSINVFIRRKKSIISQLENNTFSFGWLDELSKIQTNTKTNTNDIRNNWNEYCLNNGIYVEDIDKDTFIEQIDIIIDYLKNYYNDLYYLLIQHRNIILYSISNNLSIKYDNIICNDKLTYNDELNLYTYKYKDKTYAFYYINIDIDNTNNSFNVLNEYNLNINFDSIDNVSISDSKFNKFFIKNFYLLEPFLKLNIFNEFTKKNNTIIYPYESEINIEYMNSLLKDNSVKKKYLLMNTDDRLYDSIVKLSKPRKIKLLRYFNYITPLLVKTNVIKDCYELQFMNNDNKTKNTKKYNIFAKNDINIYKYNGIKYYTGQYSYNTELFMVSNKIEVPEIIYQNEYKHFNDNLIYNLPEEIIFSEDVIYTDNELLELKENKDKIYNKKISILLKYFKKLGLDYNDNILFLFNKYDSSINIEPVRLKAAKNGMLYKISYKFKLI